MKHIDAIAASLKRLIIFVVSVALIALIYFVLLPDKLQVWRILGSLVLLWLFTAYFVLPRVHRLLAQHYTPLYFIGRTTTADLLLGDPVNLALNGHKRDVVAAMQRAGWRLADPITPTTAWKMIVSTVSRREYPTAPVSNLFLFGRQQDLAFQMEVDNNPRKRHHVRFWKTPAGWYLPGGYKVDWIGAASYDDAVKVSLKTLQFTHRIDPNIDDERDFLIGTLKKARVETHVHKVEHFFPPFSSHNGGGDRLVTDGSLVIADLK